MPFSSWCALRRDQLRLRLDDDLQHYERRLLVWEHEYGYWAQFRKGA